MRRQHASRKSSRDSLTSHSRFRIGRKPIYGRRLLTVVIDERARDNHAQAYASIPRTNNPRDGYRDISYRQFANAVNRCAIWLKAQIGLSTKFEALAYMGPVDLRYQILCMGAVKAGYVVGPEVLSLYKPSDVGLDVLSLSPQ